MKELGCIWKVIGDRPVRAALEEEWKDRGIDLPKLEPAQRSWTKEIVIWAREEVIEWKGEPEGPAKINRNVFRPSEESRGKNHAVD
jgi:hypothetical protein